MMSLDIHHIFPEDWCKKRGLKPAVFNTIVNKTPISYKANRKIGGARALCVSAEVAGGEAGGP